MAATKKVERTSFPQILSLRTISIILVLAAIAISAYLSYVEYADKLVACVDSGTFDCQAVQSHSTSKIVGIPVAYLGLVGNIGLLLMLLLEDRISLLQTFGVTLFFVAVLVGFGFSVYLVYLQAFVIHAYCPWCLTHEALYALLFLAAGLRLRAVLQAD